MTGRDIYEKLMREIAAGKFAKDGKLPSEAKLGDLFGVSRMTVRGALAELQRQGLIEKRNGAGSFLTRRALRTSGINRPMVQAETPTDPSRHVKRIALRMLEFVVIGILLLLDLRRERIKAVHRSF